MKLADIFPPWHLLLPLPGGPMRPALRAMLRHLSSIYTAIGLDEVDDLEERLAARELLSSTVVATGAAIPHVDHHRFHQVVGMIGISPDGIEFSGSPVPVRIVLLLLLPEGRSEIAQETLDRLSRLAVRTDFVERLQVCTEEGSVAALLQEADGWQE